MLKVPVFKRNMVVCPVGDRLLFLIDEHKHIVLRGSIYPHLARWADGEHTVDEIVAGLGSRYSLPKIMTAFEKMVQKCYLVEKEPDLPDCEAAWWDYLGVAPAQAQKRVAECPVELHCFGDLLDRNACAALLKTYGFNMVDRDGVMLLALTDDYLRPELAELNQRALDSKRPWLLAKPCGVTLWMGPAFVPGYTGCWQCLAKRLTDNRQAESFLKRQNGGKPIFSAVTRSSDTFRFGMGFIAVELGKMIALRERYTSLTGRVELFDLTALEKTDHILTRRPQCPACGEEKYRRPIPPQPVRLQSCKKRVDVAGGHRTQLPGQTLKRLEKHISSITGIVNNLEELSDPDNPLINTYLAGHNFAMLKDDLFFLSLNLRGRSGGKGATDAHARASAVCEAIERFCGINSQYAYAMASYNRMKSEKGDCVFHPRQLALFSDRQYAEREAWNAAQPETGYHRVPKPFDDDREVAWAGAWSLTRETMCYVPAAHCFYGYRDTGPISIIADSNGSAAGNTLEEAILQGLMEVVERDCVSLWWYNMIPFPEVDLASFNDPYVFRLIEYYRSIDRELWVLDITSDLGIPTFAGVSRRAGHPAEDIVIGFGSHPDPRVALIRALTEVNQFLPAVIRRNPDGTTRYWFPDREAITWWKTAKLCGHPYLAPDKNVSAKKLEDYPQVGSDDILEEIMYCRKIIENAGLEVLAMDMSHPEIELSVAKVIVPGLNHYWRRLGGVRMYEVPVKMGWLGEPRPEEAMNPFNIFF
ncbi:MAG: TOMM precursor leader peptide-binding protein [Deltaproteobacteria bacterium]|nr:TOMM precursor leader peptide-binding protein [Deltaproteobacteria bacterium]